MRATDGCGEATASAAATGVDFPDLSKKKSARRALSQLHHSKPVSSVP
jgi:hypothetical protein